MTEQERIEWAIERHKFNVKAYEEMRDILAEGAKQVADDGIDASQCAINALREKLERMKGCDWCIGFCPGLTGDPHADYQFCPYCGRKLTEGSESK